MKNKNFEMLFEMIRKFRKEEKRVNIAIDGYSTSGKTTLASLIQQEFDANVFHMDDYFRSKAQGKSDSPYASNIDMDRFMSEIVKSLKEKEDTDYHSFDCKTQKLSQVIHKELKQINVVEGAYSMQPEIVDVYQIKVFLKSSIFQQIRRIIKRNGLKELINYLKKWIPNEKSYFKFCQIEKKADFVFKSKH